MNATILLRTAAPARIAAQISNPTSQKLSQCLQHGAKLHTAAFPGAKRVIAAAAPIKRADIPGSKRVRGLKSSQQYATKLIRHKLYSYFTPRIPYRRKIRTKLSASVKAHPLVKSRRHIMVWLRSTIPTRTRMPARRKGLVTSSPPTKSYPIPRKKNSMTSLGPLASIPVVPQEAIRSAEVVTPFQDLVKVALAVGSTLTISFLRSLVVSKIRLEEVEEVPVVEILSHRRY